MQELAKRLSFFKKRAEELKDKKLWENHNAQVVMSARNAGEWLPIILSSIENSMQGRNWIMNFGDDNSDDSTLEIAKSFSKYTTAKLFNIIKYKKAKTVGQAKNRIIKKSLEYAEEYPAIFLSDADDFFTEERALLLGAAERKNAPFVVGSWYYCKNGNKEIKPAKESVKDEIYGPWATLIHSGVIPSNGELFFEKASPHEDLFLWNEFRCAGVPILPVDEIISCYYNARDGSVSKNLNRTQKVKDWENYQKLKHEISLINV